MSERLNELYILTQKAQKMEMINEEIALKLYLEIFEKYTPNISKTYESAIRLLEKRHRLQEALIICEQAIELINADEVSGTAEKFETVKLRLLRKINDSDPEGAETVKKKFKLKKRHIIIFLMVIAFFYFLMRYTTPFGDLDVDLEGKGSLEGGEGLYAESTEPQEKSYPITTEMIDLATRELKKNIEIKEATIIPQKGTLGIAIIVSAGTSVERAQGLAEEYIKALAGAASAAYSDLKSPGSDSLGELYDFYELVITVGTGPKEEEFIATGTKARGSVSIYWR